MSARLSEKNFKIKFSITNKMLDLLFNISTFITQLSNLNNLTNYPKLKKINRAKAITASLSIENNTLSYEQVVDVINGKMVLGPKTDTIAVVNANNAYNMIDELEFDNSNDLLRAQNIMMSQIAVGIGQYRKVEVFADDKTKNGYKVVYKPPLANNVPSLVNQLFYWLKNDESNLLIKSCVFHYYLVCIHPFNDGNGRTSRLWQTVILSKLNPIFKWVPIESIIYSKRKQYYDILNKCDETFDCTLFIEFMLEAILESVKNVWSQTKQTNSTLPTHIIKLLNIMGDDLWSSTQLMCKLKLNSKSGFIKNYLHPALKAGVICMVQPNNPTTKNQKYYKK